MLALLAFSFYVPMSAGQLSMAQIGYMAIGAYSSVLMYQRGWPFWVAVIGACLASSIAAAAIASVGVRLSGFGLAIVTIGFGEITRVVLNNMTFTGGPVGISSIPLLVTLPTVAVPLVVLALAALRLELGQVGRQVTMMREDLEAAEALGVPTTMRRWLAITCAGPIAGYAGAMYAFSFGFIAPDSFNFNLLIEVVTAVVVGGMTTVIGSLAGSVFTQAAPDLLSDLNQWRLVAYAGVMILTLRFRPEGIVSRGTIRTAVSIGSSLLSGARTALHADRAG